MQINSVLAIRIIAMRPIARMSARAQRGPLAPHANGRLEGRRADPVRPKVAHTRGPGPVTADSDEKRKRH